MSNLVIGSKPGVGPVLKIMKDEADDPFDTPNTNYGKFLFNSEVQKVGYIRKIIKIEADFTTYPPVPDDLLGTTGYYLYPPGSTIDTCEIIIRSYSAGGYAFQAWCFCQSYFGLDFFPLTEIRPVFGSGADFRGPEVDTRVGSVTNRGFSQSRSGVGLDIRKFGYGIRFMPYWTGSEWRAKQAAVAVVTNNPNGPARCLLSVFDLPDKAVALPDNSGVASPGQEVIRIDSAASGLCRVALPGKVVTDSNPENFILHEDKIPAKILRSGEIDVDQGQTVAISCPLALTKYTYMDYHVKRKADAEWWHPPYFAGQDESQSLSFTYSVDTINSRVDITNTSDSDLTIRYAICAASEEPETSGGSKILLRGNDGAQDFVQIKRPGSSDSAPNLNDIMVDTRLSYLPILAEGFLSYPDDFPTAVSYGDRNRGERMATVSFTNPDGLLPMVKVGSVFAGSGASISWLYSFDPVTVWGNHEVRHTTDPTWNGRASGESVWANIKQESVDFYSGGLNPYWLVGVNIQSYPSTMLGLRYYIFGLPQSL